MGKQLTYLSLSATNEERFQALLTATSDVVYSMNPDWTILTELGGHGARYVAKDASPGWQSMHVYEEDLELVQHAIQNAIAARSIFQLEHRVKRTDGSVGWTFSRAVPIFGDNGEVKEWFGVESDITERKLAEQRLAASKEVLEQQKRTYETITAGTPDLMYVFDLQYRFTYANAALLQMWGKTWDEAIGKNLLENGYEPWHADMHEREIDSIIATGNPVRGEVAFPHATLGRRLYDYILNPVFNESGEVVAVSGTTRDVTERDQWQQQLTQSAERLQAMNEEFAAINEELTVSNDQLKAANERLSKANADLISAQKTIEEGKLALRLAVEAANFGTWYINSVTREFIADARLKELFGYYPDETLSIEQAIAQITVEYRDFISDKFENALYNNGDYDVCYPVIGLHDDKLRWLRAIGNLTADPSGTFSAFTGVVMDITEQKMEEIRKNDFMGVVSHELKTPLTSLSAYLQLLESRSKQSSDEIIHRALSQSVKQTKRMTDMINGFLDLSRLESAKIHVNSSKFDIGALIGDSREEALMLYGTHKFIFDPVESHMVNGDRGKLGQVISNLIGNAVKYSKPGSVILVSCIGAGEQVRVSVKDEGMGMRKEELSKIFGRFYRAEGNKLISGFGIGLYVCSEIIKLHGGEIWAESDLGKGSLLTFALPRL
ncbi:PAS domain S-box protein [Pedobacter sp. 22163]|uniref:PAS domain S-box protein n=1 Tax=Pedobacter sp. 22163 TaxID=3453883 RepID=UPI003F84716D